MMKQSQVVLLVAAVTALQPVARLQRAPVRMAASDVLASDRILIAPALATSNVAKLGEEAQAAVAAGADCLHFNVMDGQFPVRQAGLEVLFIILVASMQHESAWRPRTRRLRLIHPNV